MEAIIYAKFDFVGAKETMRFEHDGYYSFSPHFAGFITKNRIEAEIASIQIRFFLYPESRDSLTDLLKMLFIANAYLDTEVDFGWLTLKSAAKAPCFSYGDTAAP